MKSEIIRTALRGLVDAMGKHERRGALCLAYCENEENNSLTESCVILHGKKSTLLGALISAMEKDKHLREVLLEATAAYQLLQVDDETVKDLVSFPITCDRNEKSIS